MRQIYYADEFPIFEAKCIWNGYYFELYGNLYYKTRKFNDIVYILVK